MNIFLTACACFKDLNNVAKWHEIKVAFQRRAHGLQFASISDSLDFEVIHIQ